MSPPLAFPLHSSPIDPLSMLYPSAIPSSVHRSSRVVLESGVNTAVAALDREIQHPDEYRTNAATSSHAVPAAGGRSDGQQREKIIRLELKVFARSSKTSA